MKGKVVGTVVAGVVALGLMAAPATATHITGEGSRDPATIAKDMFADPTQVTGASLAMDSFAVETSHAAVMGGPGPLAGFPTNGAGYGIISSGNTNAANDPDAEQNKTTDEAGGPGALGQATTNEGNDLAGLTINFTAPAVASPCINMNVKFLSDEFPEFVGSAFNDFAMAALDNTAAPSVDPTTKNPSLAGNFLFDGKGGELTINNNFLVQKQFAAGTTWDGSTPELTAQVPTSAGAHTMTIWVGDVGDSIYDTNLFVDNIQIIDKSPCPVATFGPSFIEKIKAKLTATKVILSGQLLPPAPGQKVIVTLFAKGSPFKKVGKKKDKLNSQSKFKATFGRPDANKCKVQVAYKGDASHFPTTEQKKFKC